MGTCEKMEFQKLSRLENKKKDNICEKLADLDNNLNEISTTKQTVQLNIFELGSQDSKETNMLDFSSIQFLDPDMIQNSYVGYIYLVVNKKNNKKYIGQHRGLFTTSYLGSGKLIKQAVDKYGKDAFNVHLLCVCTTVEELNEKECYYIEHLNAVESQEFYNLRPGGNMTYEPKPTIYTEERKLKNRLSHLGRKYKPMSLQGRINISKAGKGKKRTPEQRKLMSERSKNRRWINNGSVNKMIKIDMLDEYLDSGWVLGILPSKTSRKPVSKETRELMRQNKLDKPRSAESRQKQSQTMLGHTAYNKSTIWVNNGLYCRMIPKERLEEYQILGYVQGRGKLKKQKENLDYDK